MNPPRPSLVTNIATRLGLGALWTYSALMLILVGTIYITMFVFMLWAPYALYTHDHPVWALIVGGSVAGSMFIGWRD